MSKALLEATEEDKAGNGSTLSSPPNEWKISDEDDEDLDNSLDSERPLENFLFHIKESLVPL